MTSPSFPADLGQFVQQQLAAGKYQSEEELVINAVRVLREFEVQQQQLCRDVEQGMDQLERGAYHQYDDQGLRDRFEQLKDRLRKRIETECKNG